MPDSMPDAARYARYFVADCVHLTLTTIGQEPVLNDETDYHALRAVLNRVKRCSLFETVAFVLLPEHVHLLVRPGEDVNTDSIVRPAMAQFEQDRRQMLGMPSAEQVWQRSYSMQRVQGVDDFAVVLDSIHYNPVYHGLVERPEEWLHSSYQTWVERDVYKLGWGWEKPARLQGQRLK
jgi:putative transposase